MNSPNRPVLITIGLPHFSHSSSVGRSGARGLRSDLVYLHSGLFVLVHAMYGPNRPAFTISVLPHSGQRSSLSLERSCASPIISSGLTAVSRLRNGVQKFVSTWSRVSEPSSILSSSSSISLVYSTLKMSGKRGTSSLFTVSPSSVGVKRLLSSDT